MAFYCSIRLQSSLERSYCKTLHSSFIASVFVFNNNIKAEVAASSEQQSNVSQNESKSNSVAVKVALSWRAH